MSPQTFRSRTVVERTKEKACESLLPLSRIFLEAEVLPTLRLSALACLLYTVHHTDPNIYTLHVLL